MVFKAVVLGAAGGIGQPLSLLLKTSHIIDKLALYDIVNTPGVAADLSHINTKSEVEGFLPADDGLKKALKDANLVVIPAGVPRKPGMSRDDLFNVNAGIVRDLATAIAATCPQAFILVISNPVNSTVPIVAEVLKKAGVFNPKRLFGVSTLDVIRASTFTNTVVNKQYASDPYGYARSRDQNPMVIPVIGGHSGVTIIPLLSQMYPPIKLLEKDIEALTNRIQFGGDEVVKAKDGAGSATLSMAYAAFKFIESLIKASVLGQPGIIECSYVNLDSDPETAVHIRKLVGNLDYFAVPVALGPQGVEKLHTIEPLSEYERGLLSKSLPELEGNIKKGVEFVGNSKL